MSDNDPQIGGEPHAADAVGSIQQAATIKQDSPAPQPDGQDDLARSGVELVFGLIGAVGADLARIQQELDECIRPYDYRPEPIRVSEAISDLPPFAARLKAKAEELGRPVCDDERIELLMKFGDELRAQTVSGDSAAMLAVNKIADMRAEKYKGSYKTQKRAFIINSLKHPSEIDKLREIYGNAFIAIAVHSPREKRIKSLCVKFAVSHRSRNAEQFVEIAKDLVAKDEKTIGNDFGQNVRECFPKADFFLSEKSDTVKQIRRFIGILFGNPFETPTIDEFGQFFAKAAALRSADLSRQVGAVLTSKSGDVLATGCNEVPRANGGYVWPDDISEERDYRDFRQKHDANAVMKSEIFTEIYTTLINAGWFSEETRKKTIEDLLQESLYIQGAILKEARAANIIEFGRIIHAEMAAITDAARLGIKTKGTTLYCTTFPCHMCARHIIAAGIDRVVYIEPYPKSMTKDLYQRSVQVEDEEADSDAVKFTSFVGVAPDRFMELFQMSQRKDKRGYTVNWSPKNAKMKLRISPSTEREIFFLRISNESLLGFLRNNNPEGGGMA